MESMLHFSRRIKLSIVFFAVVISGYVVVHLVASLGGVPQEFNEARLQGALIAQNIVDLSNKSASDLGKINELDRQRNFNEALALTTQVIAQSQEIRNQAVALSSEIEKMTRSLSGIGSDEARQAALESITSRLALISRLINYSASLENLLSVLRNRFAGAPSSHTKVQGMIDQINAEVTAINSFNNQAVQAMERFDALIK
ncbi:MAG: hypothetical protein AAB652_00005 [Patescibacteria group bacterium]